MKKQLIAILLLVVFVSPALAADTLLVGWDSTLYHTDCFVEAANLTACVWKAVRIQAVASGTISFFRQRIPPETVTIDSNDDNYIWAIYEDNNGSISTLKGYGYYPSYNWTTIGKTGPHDFPPTTTVTNLNIIAGNWYWLVADSRDMDGSTAVDTQIPTERGNNDPDCPIAFAPPIAITATDQQAWCPDVKTSPPAPTLYTYPLASPHAFSVWASDEVTPPSATGCTISGGSFR